MLVQPWPTAVAVTLAGLDTVYESARGDSAGGLARVSSACGILDCKAEVVVVGGQGGKPACRAPVSIKPLQIYTLATRIHGTHDGRLPLGTLVLDRLERPP